MISINVAAGAKRPHPTEQYGSISATVSLQGEAGSLSDIPGVMRDLFQAAQAGVDEHLASQTSSATVDPSSPQPRASSTPASTSGPGVRPNASHPYRPTTKRSPASVTDSQLRYLGKLITDTRSSLPAILAHHHVGDLRDLSCKAAAQLIDELKAQAVPA
ncbi:MAG: hypothetical protein J0M02_01275 [Planctomycetes bacterium]|nr:hypothetical protein [Planctomycetota bacterium]